MDTYVYEDIYQEDMLPEGGYTKLLRSIAGLESGIDSLGIITAENPMAKQLSSKENKARNKQLSKDLRERGYGFYQIKGKYGNIEKPYVVPNVTLGHITELGQKYRQESVIFVQKAPDGMVARLVYTGSNEPSIARRVILPLASDTEDFYSIYKGRKFVIPFFDDLFADVDLAA